MPSPHSESAFIPEVGQLLYSEHRRAADDTLEFAELVFVDTPFNPGESWDYTQIAMIEQDGESVSVDVSFTAGGGLSHAVAASDDQIRIFVSAIMEEGEDDLVDLGDWLDELDGQEQLLQREKERLGVLAEAYLLEHFGQQAVDRLRAYRSNNS